MGEPELFKLKNGGFSPALYRRGDQESPPDTERDRALIEDALYCIATAFQKSERRARALRAVAAHAQALIYVWYLWSPDA